MTTLYDMALAEVSALQADNKRLREALSVPALKRMIDIEEAAQDFVDNVAPPPEGDYYYSETDSEYYAVLEAALLKE
jgi:hypothetical protein